MKIEEAIIKLEYRKDFATSDQIEAINMAIRSLKAWDAVFHFIGSALPESEVEE